MRHIVLTPIVGTSVNYSFPILLDETGEVSTGLYGMRGLPTSYFIDTNSVLRRIQIGEMLPEKLDEYILEILPN